MEAMDWIVLLVALVGTIPTWIIAFAAISTGRWARKIYKEREEGKPYLTVTNNIDAVSGSKGMYNLMVTFCAHNPSKVPMKINKDRIQIWDISDPTCDKKILSDNPLLEEEDIRVDPGETAFWSYHIPLPNSQRVLKVETVVINTGEERPDGKESLWGQQSLFEFSTKEKEDDERQEYIQADVHRGTADLGWEEASTQSASTEHPADPEPTAPTEHEER